ncbi:hypothetical protein ID866_1224 [Astraeus odoratus]|nr:hypothetical protein ID866_1224 [Astraeus odoratus]
MHGFIDRIYQSGTSKHGHTIWSPDLPTQEFVDDACMVYSGHGVPAIVLAHAREDAQLTYLSMEGDGVRKWVLQRRTLHRNWNKAKKAGISALTTMLRPLQFASGGYDHRVHIWTMEENLTNASSVELAIRHTSMVHSLLAIRDTSHKLISAGADRNIHLLDLSSERIVRTIKISNFPHNVYRTESPFCTLIEVTLFLSLPWR